MAYTTNTDKAQEPASVAKARKKNSKSYQLSNTAFFLMRKSLSSEQY